MHARSPLSGLALWLVFVPALSAAADQGTSAFNGKDLSGWKVRENQKGVSRWSVAKASTDARGRLQMVPATGDGHLVNEGGGLDIYTEATFGDCLISLELMVPKGSNSGIYLMGNYEVQVFDSFGKQKAEETDIGAIYGRAAPSVNAAKAPGEWQTIEIDFTAPKFIDGKKSVRARVNKITLNGQVIQQNVDVDRPTGGNIGGGEKPTGPLMFQGDHGPVAFRNIRIEPK